MHRTFSTLKLILVCLALALAVLAVPAVNAQSVKGSGAVGGVFGPGTEFKVNVFVQSNGTLKGSYFERGQSSGKPGNSSYWIEYPAVSLVVVGNQATVTIMNGIIPVSLTFTDNGDGSVEPDYLNGSPINGQITVKP